MGVPPKGKGVMLGGTGLVQSGPKVLRICVFGGRDFKGGAEDEAWLDGILQHYMSAGASFLRVGELACGMARGADTFGRQWALKRGLKVLEYWPEWEVYGKAAGHMRNRKMAEDADWFYAFPGGSGTINMVGQVALRGKRLERSPKWAEFLKGQGE